LVINLPRIDCEKMKILLLALEAYQEFDDENDLGFDHFDEFEEKSFAAKLSHLSARIQSLCQKLQISHPDSMWIIALREGVLTENETLFLDLKQKRIFKNAMSQLTQAFPQLAIVAGVVYKNKYNNQKCERQLEKLLEYYQQNKWVEEAEEQISNVLQFQTHMMMVEVMLASKPKEVVVVHNAIYAFQGEKYFRHDKSAPWSETKEANNTLLANSVFQPAGGHAKNHLIQLEHPITKTAFNIGIEICREHYLGTLKRSGEKQALIHFLMSDSTDYRDVHAHGSYFFHLDSYQFNSPKLIVVGPSSVPVEVAAYANDFLNPEDEEIKPVETLYSVNYAKREAQLAFLKAWAEKHALPEEKEISSQSFSFK
jgi:hypothetical protein